MNASPVGMREGAGVSTGVIFSCAQERRISDMGGDLDAGAVFEGDARGHNLMIPPRRILHELAQAPRVEARFLKTEACTANVADLQRPARISSLLSKSILWTHPW